MELDNPMVMITTEPIDPCKAQEMISGKGAGSLLLHYAVVKEQEGDGGVTRHIEYDETGDAEEELRTIAGEIAASWNVEELLLIRRLGRLGIGDIISLVAVSALSSEAAFAACKFGISRLKKMRSIVKSEIWG